MAGSPHSSRSCRRSVYFVLYGRPHFEQLYVGDEFKINGSQNRAAANTDGPQRRIGTHRIIQMKWDEIE